MALYGRKVRTNHRIQPADRVVCGAFKDLAQVQYLHHNDICEDEASPRAIRKFERRAFQRLMDRLLKLPRLFPAEEPY